MGADGQVTLNNTVVKESAIKVRKIRDGKILVGIAGSAADGLTLMERLEEQLKRWPDNLPRAAVELAKQWRSDKALRRLDALIAVASAEHSFIISGSGDVVEPDDGLIGIGSGGNYAVAAARALIKHSNLNAEQITNEALNIAAGICIYTNTNINIEVI
jgi:ATP-dependent HslUV protease, peptidase subunit HslV